MTCRMQDGRGYSSDVTFMAGQDDSHAVPLEVLDVRFVTIMSQTGGLPTTWFESLSNFVQLFEVSTGARSPLRNNRSAAACTRSNGKPDRSAVSKSEWCPSERLSVHKRALSSNSGAVPPVNGYSPRRPS